MASLPKKSKSSNNNLEVRRIEKNRPKAGAIESARKFLEEIENNEDPFIEKAPMVESSELTGRMNERLDRIERKLDKILESCSPGPASEIKKEHLVKFKEEPNRMCSDSDQQIFPINDEETFDLFFQNLKDDEYRKKLIDRRWNLAKNVNTKSVNIAVKEFLKMHFELVTCVKYSCSGYGSRGTKKKKLDSKSLGVFVFECFKVGFPGGYTSEDIRKAIVQFWGRAPDLLNKENKSCLNTKTQ